MSRRLGAETMSARNNGRETGRDANGRFAPGNPGRPHGARHRTTHAVEELLQGEAEGLTRRVIDLALEGDTTALRLCLERIAPPRKDNPVQFELPEGEGTIGAATAALAVLEAVSQGHLSPTEAGTEMPLLERYGRLLQMSELEDRLAALERAVGSGDK